jgi:DNA-binding NarL/FixJ family response regulator
MNPTHATDTPGTADVIDVVLCDDHTVVLAGLERLVSTFPGIRVVAAVTDAIAALAAVEQHRPHVVLMDMAMPTIDGVEATARIMAAHPDTRVVILTSFSDRQRITAALGAGAIGYLLKDATPTELDSAIRAAARGEAPIAPKAAMALMRSDPLDSVNLSARELETLALVATGAANKVIARKLGITEATVKAHLTSIFRSIGVDNRTQAARWYERTHGEQQ